MKILYYNCYKHFPGEDRKGKYIFEIYLNDELINYVYDADVVEGWIRIKLFDNDDNPYPSSKRNGIVKIVKNYKY
jgi:hypothetical protein